MSVTEIDERLKELEEEYVELFMAETELWEEEFKLNFDDPARAEISEKRRANDARLTELSTERSTLYKERTKQRKLENKYFERPSKSFAGLISKGLGPLPQPSMLIHPTTKNLAKVRSFRLAALGLVAVAIGTLVSLTIFVPWLRTSPATLLNGLFTMWFGPIFGPIIGMVAVFALLIFFPSGIRRKSYRGKFLDQAAMFEEQWFRMGAENWTARQRVYSCVAFGVVHLVNVIYPIASILVVGAMGGVFMMVYLRTFKKTGNVKLATIASAKLHASYNRFAFLYLIVALGLTGVYTAISILTS